MLRLSHLSPIALVIAACASQPTPSAPDASHSRITTPAKVVVKQVGDVTIHTFIGPPESYAVTSHVIETSASVVVIDTQMLADYAKQLHTYVRSLGKRVDRVLVSHGHPDHYFGVTEFSAYPVYALKQSIHDMGWRHKGHWRIHKMIEGDQITDTVTLPDRELVVEPFILDGVTFELEAVQSCEDNAQLVVRLPGQRVLIAQDLVYNGYHPFFTMADFDSWIATLRRLADDDGYDYVLAGHGAPGGRALLTATADYLTEAKAVFAAHPGDPLGAVRAMAKKRPDLRGADIILAILKHF